MHARTRTDVACAWPQVLSKDQAAEFYDRLVQDAAKRNETVVSPLWNESRVQSQACSPSCAGCKCHQRSEDPHALLCHVADEERGHEEGEGAAHHVQLGNVFKGKGKVTVMDLMSSWS